MVADLEQRQRFQALLFPEGVKYHRDRGFSTPKSRMEFPNTDVKSRYVSASFLPGDRVVFNVKGNQYRLVVARRYDLGIVFVRFVGTHAEYDRIDAKSI